MSDRLATFGCRWSSSIEEVVTVVRTEQWSRCGMNEFGSILKETGSGNLWPLGRAGPWRSLAVSIHSGTVIGPFPSYIDRAWWVDG